MIHISDIKLIKTDTTLDLSQNAEKGMLYLVDGFCILRLLSAVDLFACFDVGI
ncbi:hypothetical protein R3W88_013086 [Solanum pinnatisectum]|uniref:Uncharacterized protein n=1 Tax=Solanum pinnatisectum TaxID=50273 RepID=A0AAV9LBI0_9SOLN|nr:hypothetical protein R3W88_013086 [Solanum pinnatisectum]